MNPLFRNSLSFTKLLFSGALLFTLLPIHAQKSSLITSSVDESTRVTLAGNVRAITRSGTDLGRAPDSEPTGTMMLVLGRSAAQQTSLDSYVMSASTPGSANYHHWLTPSAYNTRFGATSEDVAIVESWLASHGFTVQQVASAGNVIRFSGTMGGVSSAFQTEIHTYLVGGIKHLANATAPSVPSAIAPIVRGIASLNDFQPKSQAIRAGHATYKSKGDSQRPELTVYGPTSFGGQLSGNPNYDVYYLPAAGDAAKIYDAPNSAMNSTYSGTTWTGSGVTIGIAGDSNLSPEAVSDIARYRSFFLNETLTQAQADAQLPSVVVDGVDPGVNSDILEALVDVEQAEAFAPQALTKLYIASNTNLQSGLILAIQRAVNDNAVSILNVSFGECEQDLGAGTNALLNEVYEQAAAEGITITAAAGDTGSAGCDSSTASFGATAAAGLAVNGLASTPWNVAVGGTDFDVLYTTNLTTISQYVEVPSGPSTQLGTPPYFSSAVGYIPEEPWNDSSSSFTTYADNTPYKFGNGPENTIAGGGGLSSVAVCSGTISSSTGDCSGTMSGYAKPAFQASLTPVDLVRDIPDVSLFSGSFMSDDGYSPDFNAAWSICSDNTVNGDTDTYSDCVPQSGTVGCDGTCAISNLDTSTTPVGGTSTSAPSMAGILALVIQHQGGQRLGQADYGIYNLAATDPGIFHDITEGNNSVLCAAGSANCGSNGFIDGYNAGTGYDYATGIGSLDIAKFVNAWSSISFASTSTSLTAGTSASSLSSSAIAAAHGTTIYFNVSVSPTAATGNVVLTTTSTQENSDSIMTAPVVNGVASFSTQALPAGTYTLYARYGGDTTHSASQSQGIPVNITSETSSIQLNLNVYSAQTGALIATSPSTAVYGSQYTLNVTPFGNSEGLDKGNPATGTITLSLGGVQLGSVALNSEGTASYTLPSSSLIPGTKYALTASYSGDGSYNASSVSSSITITQDPVFVGSFVPTTGTVWTTTSDQETAVIIEAYSDGAVPTGTVTFALNGTTLATNPVANATSNAGVVGFGGSIDILPSQIGAGNTATITATYSGDANYAPATFSTSVSVAGVSDASFTLAGAGTITISTPGQTGSATVNVTPTNGFGGTVSFTCVATGTSSANAPACSIPASVNVSGTAAQPVTVTVSTTTGTTAAINETNPLFIRLGGGLSLASLMIFIIPNRSRRWAGGLCVLLLLLLIPTTGCGSKASTTGSTGGGSTGTPSGTYTYTITGSHGTTTSSTTLSVVVQ
jgi:subtilase family serine protease